MKTILAILASPRKLGNSEVMAKEISRRITEPHELKLLRLSDFDVKNCTGCYRCLFKEQRCILKDDLYLILDAIAEAEAIILVAPTYMLGANAVLKVFLDRGLSFYGYGERLWEKPAVGVAVAGIPGMEGYTPLAIESFLKLLLCDIKQVRTVYGALPGEVFVTPDNRQAAADLAAALTAPTPEKAPFACPQCGGQTFRFLGEDRVKCMLCSNDGRLRMEDGHPVIDIRRGEHVFFLSSEDALAHARWLRQMKGRFLEQKEALKKIALDYRGDGRWISPKAPEPD
jgi:multimeric flavodoxin WrbA